MVISFINEKGGSGKTTLCINMAIRLMQDGKEVIIVNCDPQDSISAFAQNRQKDVLMHINLSGNISKTLKSLVEKYEFVLIDTSGSDNEINQKAMLFSDIVVLPTKPSQLDIDVLQKMFIRVENCQIINEDLKAFVLMNQMPPNPKIAENKQMKDFIEELIQEKDNIILLNTIIHERIAYKRCFSDGLGISEFFKDKNCLKEFNNFYHEIFLKGGIG